MKWNFCVSQNYFISSVFIPPSVLDWQSDGEDGLRGRFYALPNSQRYVLFTNGTQQGGEMNHPIDAMIDNDLLETLRGGS